MIGQHSPANESAGNGLALHQLALVRNGGSSVCAPYPFDRFLIFKFSFSNRVRTLWNSLPDIVVKSESVNSFKGRLDKFWNDQEVKFNWKADIKGTGSRSDLI